MGESAGCTKTLSFELALTRVRARGVRWLHEKPEKWKCAISLVVTVGVDFSSRLPRSRGWVDWYRRLRYPEDDLASGFFLLGRCHGEVLLRLRALCTR